MIDLETVEEFYRYFYVKKYGSKHKVKFTKTTKGICETFMRIIDKEYSLPAVGNEFLWDYFLFQFNYWDDLKFENKFSDKIVIGWIVGKKAFERWKNRDKEFDWQMETYDIIFKYKLDKNELIKRVYRFDNIISTRSKLSTLLEAEIRKRYHNTDKGFAQCIQLTSLFDHTDVNCILCKFRKDCRELQRVNYPNLYKE